MFIGRAAYEWMEGRLRLVFSVVDLDRDFESTSPFVPSGNVTTFFPLGSVQVNLEDWTFSGEYGHINIERSGLFPDVAPRFLRDNTSEAFYVQAQYRFAPRWSALLRYDAFFANIDDRSGRETAAALSAVTGVPLPRHHFFQKDITFGLRWEFAQNWLIAAEYHNIDGTGALSTVDNPELNLGGGDPHWDLFTLMLSFRF
ncbi:MAG: TonB-dependent receptor [Gammaproteobacteria bacterium]